MIYTDKYCTTWKACNCVSKAAVNLPLYYIYLQCPLDPTWRNALYCACWRETKEKRYYVINITCI